MRSVAYKSYLLTVLLVIYISNQIDRVALGIVMEDIKRDLALTDTELGFLTGLAFAAFYAIMGIPIARWADRGNRITIISLTAALWSAAVALCGAVTSFVQLLLVRVAVGIGEAGCVPPAHSLIAEYFSRAERPRAVSRYMLAGPISLMLGYMAAGWLNEFYGWRTTFVVLGLPGVALAVLAWLTLKEPRLMKPATANVSPERRATESDASFKEVCVHLWRIPAFRHLLLCFSVWYFFGYGLLQWQPTFFIRSHGLQTGVIGTWFAGIHIVAGIAGVYLGGELASRYAANNERLQLLLCAAGFMVFAVLTAAGFMASTYQMGFFLLALASLGGNVAQGPVLSTIQTLVPPRMRAMSVAIIYFFANLIGFGLGPLATGALSDALQPWLGQESLRWSLVALCPGYFWAAWHLWRASRTVARDMAAIQIEDKSPVPSRGSLAMAK